RVGGDEVDVGDQPDQVGRPRVLGGGLREVVRGAAAEVLGLAHVDDLGLGVLHQVHAGRRGKGLHLLGGARGVEGGGGGIRGARGGGHVGPREHRRRGPVLRGGAHPYCIRRYPASTFAWGRGDLARFGASRSNRRWA